MQSLDGQRLVLPTLFSGSFSADRTLVNSINNFGADHEFTKLVIDLKGKDPDDAFSTVPYEKVIDHNSMHKISTNPVRVSISYTSSKSLLQNLSLTHSSPIISTPGQENHSIPTNLSPLFSTSSLRMKLLPKHLSLLTGIHGSTSQVYHLNQTLTQA